MKSLFTLAVLAVLVVRVSSWPTNDIVLPLTDKDGKTISVIIPANLCTNAYIVYTNWCDRIPANDHEKAVKDLAKGGVICKVLGCSWDEGQQGRTPDQFLNDWYKNIKRRTCRICGKCETKTEGDWR